MGKTHCLLSIMLMCICMIIPIDFFKETFWLLKDNIIFFIVGLIALVGGALLPDLDNCQSSAGSTLGPLGSICTIFMQSISSIIFTLYHGRSDMTPINQHRYMKYRGLSTDIPNKFVNKNVQRINKDKFFIHLNNRINNKEINHHFKTISNLDESSSILTSNRKNNSKINNIINTKVTNKTKYY